MSSTALKYYLGATQHVGSIKNFYKSILTKISVPKNDQLSVMDFGCASGRVFYEAVLPILPKNVSEVIGSDIDEEMLEFCRTMNTDSKVTFEKLNIAEEIPNHFQNRFDLVFSSYCLSYVRDWTKAFTNCKTLLKPNGNLLLISQIKTNPLYTTYRRMASMDVWKSYTEDYKNYITPLSSEDPSSELKSIFKNVGLELVSHTFDHDLYFEMRKRAVLGAYLALENKVLTVPKNMQQTFREDFIKLFSEETNIDFTDEDRLDDCMNVHFPTVYLHSRKVQM